ncbi:uncharacterized protein E0L32_011971 [Thyridium curvatum]|uniref:Uncharacterized protein n=1 Tax=Thyridium curvatum TaxID=1093900 RepID=A0A507BML0_9PEZI|nr:uncharacterized protein E0L32_011971 [Thyridium curvatum]TPX17970.1 hypothetical protein E0L32_011971 [Thyridium curvatum]
MAPEGGKLVTVDTSIPGPDKSVAQWDVGRGEGLLITSAAVCRGFLIVGTRRGTIHLYAKQDDQYMCVAWTKLQVKDAVTSLTPLPGRDGAPASNILATCRDGAYRIYAIDREPAAAALRLVHESSPPTMGPVQAGAVFAGDDDDNNNELVVLGFRGTSFVAWNETRQEDVAAVGCGGANRKFAYVTSSSGGAADAAAAGGLLLRFAYTKTSTLNVYSQRGATHRTVRAGGHGREVRSVCAARGGGGYVATGGEDTILRVWRRRAASGPGGGGGGGLRCVAVLNPHRTGIPALAWVGDGYLLSAGGFEDLYVWRVSRLDSAYEGLAVACESQFPDKSRDKDLRIMSIDAEPLGGDGVEEEDGMVVSMAFSNSAVKTYRYARADGWRLLAQGRYTGACPTEVRHLDVDVRGGRGLAVLVTFTDGHVTAWKADRRHPGSGGEAEYEDYTLQAAARLHQNSVKALDLVPLSTGAAAAAAGWLVITGSDDNALGVTHLLPTAAGAVAAYTFGPGHRVSKAHAAAINALRVVRHDEQAGVVVFVTGSNDQRIKTWRLLTTAPPGGEEEAGTGRRVGKIQLLDNSYSSVADPGAMEMLGPEGPLVVVGVGMETWGVGQGALRAG